MNEFIIQTDQRSLTSLSDQRLHTGWQQKTLTKLMGLRYHIQDKKGTKNSAADALSRRPHDSMELQEISTIQPTWFTDIAASYSGDQFSEKLL